MTPWHTVPLGEVVTFQRGFDLPHRARRRGNVPIVSSAGVTYYHDTSMADPPGVVTGRYGTIGELFFLAEPFWPLNTTLYVRDFNGNDPRFIYYHLQRFDFATFSGKSGVPGVNRNDLHAESVSLPVDIAEQRAIAEALSDVDALLAGLDRLIAKKRDLKQAAMQQLLTGQTRLPAFRGEWEIKALGDLVTIQKGQLITAKTLVPGDVPVIAGGKKPAYFHAAANRLGRTITISASGASAGYVAIHDGPLFASDCSTIGEAAGYSLDFVYYQLLLNQDVIYKAQTGGAQPHIHAKDLNPIPIRVPPRAEQVAIAEVVRVMDAELTALEVRRDKTRALKQGMMQELLTGRTRLV